MKIYVKNSGYPAAVFGGTTAPEGYTERTADEYRALVEAAGPVPVQPVEPTVQVPSAVERRQILLELNASTPRITLAQIEAILPSVISDPIQLEAAYIELLNSKTWERNHVLVPVIKAVLQVDDAWIDARWIAAAVR